MLIVNNLTELFALLSILFVLFKKDWKGARILCVYLIGVNVFKLSFVNDLFVSGEFLRFNLVVFIQLFSLLFFYQNILTGKKSKRISLFFLFGFLTFWIIENSVLGEIRASFQYYSYAFGVIGILVSILYYYYEQFLIIEASEPIQNRYYAWIGAGLFIWLSTELPVMGLWAYDIENVEYSLDKRMLTLKRVTSAIYYLMYLIGLIWAKKS